MPKRTTAYPYRTSPAEQKMNSHKHYNELIRKPSINSIFTRKPYSDVEEVKK